MICCAAQAQGLWRMLQGKPKDREAERAERANRERQEKLKIDDEWAAGGASTGKPHAHWRFCAINASLQLICTIPPAKWLLWHQYSLARCSQQPLWQCCGTSCSLTCSLLLSCMGLCHALGLIIMLAMQTGQGAQRLCPGTRSTTSSPTSPRMMTSIEQMLRRLPPIHKPKQEQLRLAG